MSGVETEDKRMPEGGRRETHFNWKAFFFFFNFPFLLVFKF